MDGGAWWATVHRVAKSRTQLKQLSVPLEKATSVFPSSETGMLGNCWGRTHTHTHTRSHQSTDGVQKLEAAFGRLRPGRQEGRAVGEATLRKELDILSD